MCISIRLTPVNWYFTTKMEWSMECCLCYFGFLWICEITVPLDSLIDPNKYLCVTDLAVDNRKRPKLLGVTIKINGPRQTHFVNTFHFSVEPQLISVHCPLFKFENGHLLTTARFVHMIRKSCFVAVFALLFRKCLMLEKC